MTLARCPRIGLVIMALVATGAVLGGLRAFASIDPALDEEWQVTRWEFILIGTVGGALLSLSLAAPPLAIAVFLRGRLLVRQADARSREELRLAVCPQAVVSSRIPPALEGGAGPLSSSTPVPPVA